MTTQTTPREELQALLERVEKAEGPGRELDIEIAWLADGEDWSMATERAVNEPYPHIKALSEYTASVDAALALVERKLPGWELEITSEHRDGEVIWRVGLGDPTMGWDGEANTPAPAIIAALLAALVASAESPAAAGGDAP